MKARCATSPPSSARRASAFTRSRPDRLRRAPPPAFPEFDELMDKAQAKAPARSLVSIDDVGNATAFLAHDGARLITGERSISTAAITSSTERTQR